MELPDEAKNSPKRIIPIQRNYLGHLLPHPKERGKNDCNTLSETSQHAALTASHLNPDPKGQAEGRGHSQTGKRTWEEGWSHQQLQGQAPPSTQSCRNRGKQQQPPRDPGDSVEAANSFSVTMSGQKKWESGHVTRQWDPCDCERSRRSSRQPDTHSMVPVVVRRPRPESPRLHTDSRGS